MCMRYWLGSSKIRVSQHEGFPEEDAEGSNRFQALYALCNQEVTREKQSLTVRTVRSQPGQKRRSILVPGKKRGASP